MVSGNVAAETNRARACTELLKIFAVLCMILFPACAPRLQALGPPVAEARLDATHYVTRDGTRLPLKRHAARSPRAVIVALHGFNDYRAEFDMAARWWVDHGITTYAYDQRGFGGAPQRGIWPGSDILVDDAREMIALVRAAHPGMPVYLLGMSMGGAVALTLAATPPALPVDGLILAAPAIWGWSSLNPFYKGVLWLAAHTAPAYKLTGEGLGVIVSDNIEMLQALSMDPLMIRDTRIDSIYGLVGLMERGYQAASAVHLPVLLVYGEQDQIIPREPIDAVVEALPGPKRVIFYPNGYHMILRDLQAETVWRNIVEWTVARVTAAE